MKRCAGGPGLIFLSVSVASPANRCAPTIAGPKGEEYKNRGRRSLPRRTNSTPNSTVRGGTMKRGFIRASIFLAAGFAPGAPALAADVDFQRLLKADQEPQNWMTYHGSYKSWHYSALADISAENVRNLREAWSHVASRSVRGLQSYPLAVDGVLYYSGSYNQVWALDGATGRVLWQYKQKLNEDLVAKQTHSPYNRGIAIGYGNVYMGTLDGKLAAIDMKTGKLNWETKLVNSEKLTVGFTGAPLLVKDKVIIGAQGGEWPDRGPIFTLSRSEEHTSELQSHSDLVCRLLLEKKKNKTF